MTVKIYEEIIMNVYNSMCRFTKNIRDISSICIITNVRQTIVILQIIKDVMIRNSNLFNITFHHLVIRVHEEKFTLLIAIQNSDQIDQRNYISYWIFESATFQMTKG